MTEVAQKSAVRVLPLDDVHRRSGATMTEREGWALPENYGDGDTGPEYNTVRNGGAGVIDLSARGRILVSGSEAVTFLNGLITNDVKTLAKDSWMPAAFPTVQGRLLASVRVINRGDDFLIDTESATHEIVLKLLDRFTLAGDFRIADMTESMVMVSLQGNTAEQVLRATLDAPTLEVERQQMVTATFANTELTLIRATHTAEDGFDLFVAAETAENLWTGLVESGAIPIGFAALEILRIEAGLPLYGLDMDETNVVTETNLDDAVSFTKGCYVGQEIIARIKYRGHVAKKLTGLILEQQTVLAASASIYSSDDKEIGRVTSSAFSPHLGRTVALGYVKYDYLAPWTSVKVAGGGSKVSANVAELPLVRGSWYGG